MIYDQSGKNKGDYLDLGFNFDDKTPVHKNYHHSRVVYIGHRYKDGSFRPYDKEAKGSESD